MTVLKDKRPSDKSGLTSTRIALLIVGNALPAQEINDKSPDQQKYNGLSLADQKIARRLEQLGYTIEYELGEKPNAGKACDKALVFISSTLKFAGDVDQFCCALNEIPTPVIVSAGELFAPMRMIEADSFRVVETNKLRIFEDNSHNHPMTARLYGNVAISAKPVKMNSGKPGDNAIKIAFPAPAQMQECDPPVVSTQSNQDPLAILAYESGRYMCGVNAAARRIGFFLHDETANELNSQGWVLFDVAVAWATAEKAKPFDRIYRHEWREVRRRRAKQRYDEMEQELVEKRAARPDKERVAKFNRPPEAPPPNLTGMAFSGGGIRSATFNLGLMQGLNELGWLRTFDYLSTVSGGGFIGAWWSAWLSRSHADVPDELLDHRALLAANEAREREELKRQLEQRLRFNPNEVRNARGFLRRILPPKAADDTRHKLSARLWEMIANGVAAAWRPLLENLLAEEINEDQISDRLRDKANQSLLTEFFDGRFTAKQLEQEISERPDKIVSALIEPAFDRLNDWLFGDSGNGLEAATLYSWELFQSEGIEMSTQTYRLSQDCPNDYRKLQLNRLLMEEAYPYELGQGIFPQREQIDPQRTAMQEDETNRGRRVNEEVAVDLLSAGRDPIHHLRLFANYLTPRRGALSHDTWRAVSIFSRNLLLTWAVLLPLLVVAVLLGQIFFVFSPSAESTFFKIGAWLHPIRDYRLRDLARLVAYPIGLIMNCSLALVVPWLLLPGDDPWAMDEKWWWRFRNPKWWAGALRNITAFLLAMAIAIPILISRQWQFKSYAYWILIPASFTLLLVAYGYLSSSYLPGQKQWKLNARREQVTMVHSGLLVVWALLTLLLGVAGFGPVLVDALLIGKYPKRAALFVVFVVLAATVWMAVKGSPSSSGDDRRKRKPGAKNRALFALTPPLVLAVLAIFFSWLTRNLIGAIANAKGTGIGKGLILGVCLGIAFAFFLVLTEIRWKGRFPLRFLLVLWIFFIVWGVGTMLDFADCSNCCATPELTAGKVTGWACRQIQNRKHWESSFLPFSANVLGHGVMFFAWVVGFLISGRFAVADSARLKTQFSQSARSTSGWINQADWLAINWGKLGRIWAGWFSLGLLALVGLLLGLGQINAQPVSYFSERFFVAWGLLMCGVIAICEVFFSRGSNLRARFLLAGIYLLLLMFLALDLYQSPASLDVQRAAFGLMGVLLSWVVVLGWTADPNQLSMHLFYRARLIRAYLGASNSRRSDSRRAITQSVIGDDLRIKDLENCYRGGPYHIINTTLNLVGGSDLATTQRSAAVFTMTKNYCGSSRTGYRDTREYMNGQLSLGTAVAISGAAASPAMGSMTPSAAQAMLMTLLNVRLGFWAPTPNKDYWQESQARLWPFLMLREFMSQTNDLASHCYLTDGAHFENMGLYSLVERGCRYMILSDCGADPHLQFHDLGEAIRRCRIDFDAEIDLKLNPLLNKAGGEAQAHFAVGTIKYSRRHFESLHYADLSEDARKGVIILFKPVLTGHEDADLIQYGREDAQGFPHQTTADQWYDEAQFESYRRLGQITAHALLEKLKGDELDDINQRLKSGGKISSEEVKKLFDTAQNIAEKDGPFQKKEIISVSDKEEETVLSE